MSRHAIVLGVLISGPIFAAEPAKIVPNDEQDLIFFQTSRPYRLRLHLQIEGRSFDAHWNEVMKRLFQYLDRDGNGVLSAAELALAPSVSQLKQMIQGIGELEADEAPKIADLTSHSRDGVTPAQLKGYYHRVGAAPWQVDLVSRTSNTEAMDNLLCTELGVKDERLTCDQLRQAAEKLFKLDADGDGILTPFEISPNGYTGNFNVLRTLETKGAPFFVLDRSDRGRELLAAAIVERYDRNQDGKLTPAEIAFPGEVFRRLGQSPKGPLTAKQLQRWPDLPVDLECIVRLDGGDAGVEHISNPACSLAASTKITQGGIIRINLPREQVQIVRLDTAPQRAFRIRQAGMELFDLAAQGKETLESKDVFRPPFSLVPVFRLADRNGDNRLSRVEFREFLDLQSKLVTRSTILTLMDRGNSLFDFLDADHDHRLSQRELMTAWERLAPWGDAKTRSIDRANIPRQFQIVISHGKPLQAAGDPGAASAMHPESRLRGPTWFRKMDRNADGDVSRSEFLGSEEQFRRLDRNGDGLIDFEEAQAGSREKKK